VGERRNRKEQNGGWARKQNGLSRRSSMRSSKSSEAAGKPSLLNIFGPGTSKKPTSDRPGLSSKLHLEDANDRRTSSYTTSSETSGHELSSTATTRDSANELFEGRDSHSDTERSNPSERQYHLFSYLGIHNLHDKADSIISSRISILWMD
jgi:hypothetical protein